ncbi:MAG: folate-binding protein [Pigmentiphaga sp.]|nr:folate-binding protein [Pigmentiphaga sp.]
MTVSPSSAPHAANQALLDSLRVVRVTGADAVGFLHGQLTHDVEKLTPGHARLAAYCNAKGRVQATLVLWRADDAGAPVVYFFTHASVVDALLKRLRMFVLRAKVVFELLDWSVSGVWAETGAGPAAWHTEPADAEGGVRIGAPAAAPLAWRAWQVQAAPVKSAEGDPAAWACQEIRAGLPWISAATFELFTPLMINFDLIDGVSFTKGCYPGQEVVARSHYRGKQKRRTHRGRLPLPEALDPAVLPGSDLYTPGAVEPVGRVINAAACNGTLEVLFEATFDTIDANALHLGSPEGPQLILQALPYDPAARSA